MKKAFFWILLLVSLLILVVQFLSLPFGRFFGIKEQSGIKIFSLPEGAEVFIDEVKVGQTPYEDNYLMEQEYSIRIASDRGIWQGKLKPKSGTLAVINRQLSNEASESAGEVLTLEKGSGVTVYSWPQEAEVEIDGKKIGKTPLTSKVDSGEHTFVLSRSGYLKRSIKASIPEEYHLNLSVDLALSEVDLSTINTPSITVTQTVVVKDTPTNFLRVRDKPSTGGKEIARVLPGDELVLLEENPTWIKVRLPDGKEGYVSAVYVEKKE